MALNYFSFGPFTKGVSDTRNTSLDAAGLLRMGRHLYFDGVGKLRAANGSTVSLTLMDDGGGPAEVTSVCEIVQWADTVLAVAHSTVTDKAYLYRLDSGLTGYYNLAGAFTASATALPLATALWTSMTDSPVVTIAEMNGEAHIACTNASTASTQSFPTRVFTGSAITDLTADIDGSAGAETVYALGVFSFQSHRWMWGFGSGATAATGYRPDLLRFGGPIGGSFTATGSGSFSVGHRVKSLRESVVGVCVAGEVAYIGTSYSLWPVVGFGFDTWDKSNPLDESFGFIGPKAACAANGVCYYWSPRGPMRVSGLGRPEPLWDMIPATVASVVDPEKIVASFDPTTDQVVWFFRGNGVTGNQLVCAFDIRRGAFLGPDRDIGVVVGAANTINPVSAPNAAAAVGPSGAPTTPVTSAIGTTHATAGWTNGDATAATTVEYRVQGGTTYTTAGTTAIGATTFVITGLVGGVPYEWRAYHLKNGSASAYVGPVAGSQFTTTTTLTAPSGLSVTDTGPSFRDNAFLQWTNSAETGASTELYVDSVYQGVVSPGVSSAYLTLADGTYDFSVRHIRSGYTASAYNGPVTQTITQLS